MNNSSIQMPKQQPSNNAVDPRSHMHRPNIHISPQSTPTQDPPQYHGNCSSFSPYCHPDQHMRENAMYPRDYHYDHMGMSPPGAFNNYWPMSHGYHHPHPEMGYNYCMPPPFPHYQYGCCAPSMNDKMPCNKMASHQATYQKKPYGPAGLPPYKSRRRKQVSFQNTGESTSQQPGSMANYEQGSNAMETSLASVNTTPPAEATGALPPGYKVFNISVEATPSGYQMSAPDGLTLSEEHIENIIKVVNTGKPVYTPPDCEGSAQVISPDHETATLDERYLTSTTATKADMNPSLMAGDAGMVYYEQEASETEQPGLVQQQEAGVQYNGPTEETSRSPSENSQSNTIVIQKSVYCHSNGIIEKLPQEYIQLSSSNLSLYGQADMPMPGTITDENAILQIESQQRETHLLPQVYEEEKPDIVSESNTVEMDSMSQQSLKTEAAIDSHDTGRTEEYDPCAESQTIRIVAPETGCLQGSGEGQGLVDLRRESEVSQNLSDAGSEEDIFISVTDNADSLSSQNQ